MNGIVEQNSVQIGVVVFFLVILVLIGIINNDEEIICL